MTGQPESDGSTDATRQRILDAAFRLFSTNGYTRTSTRALAAEAGVNEVTIFRHFGSKQNLLKAVIEDFNQEAFPATFEKLLTGDYAVDIPVMAKAMAEAMAEGFAPIRLLMCEAQEVPTLLELMTEGSEHNQGLVANYFRQQIEAGVVRDDLDPETMVLAFDALFSTPVINSALFDPAHVPKVPDDDTLRQLAGIFVRGTIRQQD
jgi:TetR/AcrR family transcriptional repressor of mexJK operon